MFSKEDEKLITIIVKEINDRKTIESKAATYKDVPSLEELADIIDKGLDDCHQSKALAYPAYVFIAEQYTSLERLSIAAKYNLKALKAADGLLNPRDIKGVLYRLLRDRNAYIDDDCSDIRPYALKVLPEEIVDELYKERLAHRRIINRDPVECSLQYLAVIDEVEEKIENNRTMKGMGSCFEIWELKQKYLAERGVDWTSPSMLNPNIMFD